MKDASPETQRVLDAALKASKVLDNQELNDHASTLAVLEALAQQRAEKRLEGSEQLTRVLKAVCQLAENLFAEDLSDHAQAHAVLKVMLMRRINDHNERRQTQRALSIDRAEAAMAGALRK